MGLDDIIFPNYFWFDLNVWVSFDAMSDEEKKQYPRAFFCDGYLKTYEYKEAWANAFLKADDRQKQQTRDLPNFDPDIFYQITGIDYFIKNK